MTPQSVTHASFVLERTFKAAPERVFAAFADPAQKRRWWTDERAMRIEEFTPDFRVGGHERTRSRFPEGSRFPGALLVNDTCYQDIVPNRRIVLAYTMTIGERRMSASLATFEIGANDGGGTVLVFTEQSAFFEGADGAEIRKQGWSQLLDALAKALS